MDLPKAAQFVVEIDTKIKEIDREISSLQSKRHTYISDKERAEAALRKSVGPHRPLRVFGAGEKAVVVQHRTVKDMVNVGSPGQEESMVREVVDVSIVDAENWAKSTGVPVDVDA